MKPLLVVACLAACASATTPGFSPGGGGDDGTGTQPDAPGQPTPDASPDAPPAPQEVTLSQVASMMPTRDGQWCGNLIGDIAAAGAYRVFTLADYQITGVFHLTKVSFGVYQTNDSPKATVKVGVYGAAPDGNSLQLSQITSLMSKDVTVTGNGVVNKVVDVPIVVDVPAGSRLVVEIAAPSNAAGPQLILGANSSAETQTGYVRMAQCNGGSSTPRSLAQWETPNLHVLVSATGMK
jgi:hypothetical protein